MKEIKDIRCENYKENGTVCYRWFRTQKDYIEHCRVKHPAIYEKIKIKVVSG